MNYKASLQTATRRSLGQGGLLLGLPLVAYSAAHAQTGEKMPTALAKGASFTASSALIAGASMIHPVAGIVVGIADAVGLLPTDVIERKIFGGARWLSKLDRNMRRIQTGGDYQDTETAARLRLRAVQEMSGALLPARRFLGLEAQYLHR